MSTELEENPDFSVFLHADVSLTFGKKVYARLNHL